MADGTDVFEIMHTTRAMRRLKPDPVPDALIHKILAAGQCAASGGNSQRWRFLVIKDPEIKKKVQVYYKRAFDEVIGPRYQTSEPPPGVTRERYMRQHAAVKYLTDHFHEAPVRIVDLSGGAEHAAGGARARPRRDIDDPTPALREGDRSGDGHTARLSLLRDPADRLSDGPVRAGRPRAARRRRLSRSLGSALSGSVNGEVRMARIAPISGKADVAAEYHPIVDAVLKVFGQVRGPFSILLHSPPLAERVLPLVTFFREESVVEPRLRSLAILAAVRERAAAYVWAAQVGAARRNGVPEATIDLIRAQGDPATLSADERDVILYTRQLMRTNRVDEAVFDALKERHGARWLVELTAAANYFAFLSGIVNAFDVPAPPEGDKLPG